MDLYVKFPMKIALPGFRKVWYFFHKWISDLIPTMSLFSMKQPHQKRTLKQIQYHILYLLKVISWPFPCRSISHKQFCQYLWQWSWSSGSILYQGLHFSLFNKSHISDKINAFQECMSFPQLVIKANIVVMKACFSKSEEMPWWWRGLSEIVKGLD